jgi:molybdopterin synthase sulfur carrier subunit
MNIRVELQSYLDQYAPDDNRLFDYELPDGATVSDLLRKLGVPEDLASVVIVSDENRTREYELSDGDRVTVLPPLAGG